VGTAARNLWPSTDTD